jgi:hypothetical protein
MEVSPLKSEDIEGTLLLAAPKFMLYAGLEDPYSVRLRWFELNEQSDEWEGSSGSIVSPIGPLGQIETTSYSLTSACANGSHTIYLIGQSDIGDAVIERWTLGEQDGSRYFWITKPNSSPGTPLPISPTAESGIVTGPAYVPMASRPLQRRVKREEVMRKSIGAKATWIACDAEARYLVFGTESPKRVYQYTFGQTDPLLLLGDESGGVRKPFSADLAAHGGLGRLIHLGLWPDLQHAEISHLVWIDGENDGTFELKFELTQSEWQQQGFEGAVWYRTDFIEWTTQ